MDIALCLLALAPLTADQYAQVQRAAAAVGQSVEDFARDAVLDAAADPFLAALERAVDTVTARTAEDRIQHDYAV
ncbi:hypothetical protein [Streptomyces cahuitamycinicus]|uniref:Uncharacterized protein n=1 Tax=Streptomyces cahuitamycinicus TaxID=2070367 RepID=A0A2N8TTK8_9ACTN|nr:hypothetical protein [Streptomyces cahuitamycinicus]PNG22328.1 hypothetical protein C1J00_09950 [Streptomyces cahuitamycinicus]